VPLAVVALLIIISLREEPMPIDFERNRSAQAPSGRKTAEADRTR
jgi:hypothetical protein